jgi:hypothetical protein
LSSSLPPAFRTPPRRRAEVVAAGGAEAEAGAPPEADGAALANDEDRGEDGEGGDEGLVGEVPESLFAPVTKVCVHGAEPEACQEPLVWRPHALCRVFVVLVTKL